MTDQIIETYRSLQDNIFEIIKSIGVNWQINQKPTQEYFNGQRVSDQGNLGFIVIKVIIHSVHSATAERKNRTRLGFKQYNVILPKEQSLPRKRKSSFKGENMQT